MATGVAVGMKQNLPGGNSAVVPPDPMPNSGVKRRSADGSVGSPHARVGHCQASIKPRGHPQGWPFCYAQKKKAQPGWALLADNLHFPTNKFLPVIFAIINMVNV